MRNVIFAFLLLISQVNAQTFTQIGSTPFVLTDIDFDGQGRMWQTLQQGALLCEYDTVATFPVQFVNECGLVGLCMHRNYAYLHISGQDSVQRVIRFDTLTTLLDTIVEVYYTTPFSNRHRGGDIVVNDSVLYCTFGYGFSGEDAQDLTDYRGKLLKVSLNTLEVEIVAFGLRNPFRFGFNQKRNEGYIADVGSNIFEEVNYFTGNYSLLNMGWPCFEGDSQLLDPDTLCNGYAYSEPEFQYYQATPRGIIGGVYLDDKWYFADRSSGFGGYMDTNLMFHEFEVLFPLDLTGMAVNPITKRLNIATWIGDIYEMSELPLSLPEDSIEVEPDPAEFDFYDKWMWQKGWGFRFWDTLGRGYNEPPRGTVFYDRYYQRMFYIIE